MSGIEVRPYAGQAPRKGLRMVCVAVALWLMAGRSLTADTVEDARGVFQNVTIVALEDDKLVFAFNDGRSLQRQADRLKQIAISSGNDLAADELTRAEALRIAEKRRDALALYERAAAVSRKPWVRDFATMRLVTLYDESGDLWRAYQAFYRLAGTHPHLAERVQPRRLPRPDSEVCRRILKDVNRRLKRPQPEPVVTALERFREAIMRRPATATAGAPRESAPAGLAVPSAPGERMQTAAGQALAALRRGDTGEATRLAGQRRARDGGADSDAWRLFDAELALVQGEPRRAGLLAMEIVLTNPETDVAAEAMYLAGKVHEQLGRTAQAIEAYRQCAAHLEAGEELKRRAAERIEALSGPATARAEEGSAP